MKTPDPKHPETLTEHTQAGKVRGGSADSFHTKLCTFLRQMFISIPGYSHEHPYIHLPYNTCNTHFAKAADYSMEMIFFPNTSILNS